MSKIKDVFFDLDRTLWDFEKNSEVALRIIFEEFNLGDYISSFNDFHNEYKKVNASFWKAYGEGKVTQEELRAGRFRDTLKHFDMDNEVMGLDMNTMYIEVSPYQTHLFPSAKEVLYDLKENNYRLHIITNGFKEVQHIKLQQSGLSEIFESVLCSEEVGKSKPHPSVFYEAMSRAQAKANQSVMIGDDFNADIIGAENVGIPGVLFDPNRKYIKNRTVNRIENLTEIPNKIIGI